MEDSRLANERLAQAALFYHSQALRLAFVKDVAEGRYALEDESGALLHLAAKRIILFSQNQKIRDLAGLKSFQNELLEAKAGFAFFEIAGMSLEEICHSKGLKEDAARFALYYFLKENPQYYYQKHERFYSRSAEERQSYQKKQEAAQARAEYLVRVELWLQKFYSHDKAKLSLPDKIQLIEELRLVQSGQKQDDLSRLLQKYAAPEPLTAFLQKIRAHFGDSFLDPALSASSLPVGFYFADEPSLKDLPKLLLAPQEAFSIDEKDSPDIDDAISLKACERGYELGIHISNIALRLAKEYALFEEALKRVSSLYLPAGAVPMFPPRFSEELFSLKKGRQMPVLSMYFRLDEAFQVQSVKAVAEEIIIAENYNFFEVEKASHEGIFQKLFRLMESLRQERASQNDQDKYQFQVFLAEGDVQLRRIESKSPARLLVEELMILYNRSMADFALAEKLPVLYRNINQIENGKRDLRRNPAFLSLSPRFHAGIGAAAYLHASSPIRRVVDLINQMQISSHLLGQTLPFSSEELQNMIPDIEKRILMMREVLQRSERYWFLKYIEKNELGKPLEAIYRGFANNLIKAEILPWGKTFNLECEAEPDSELFHLVAYKVNWDKMSLQVDLIG